MPILIAGRKDRVSAALVNALARGHDVRTLDHSGGDPRDQDQVARAASDCEVIVLAPPYVAPDAPEGEILEAATRGTYNLLTQSSAARVILLTSLRLFERYPADYWVAEQWAPLPTTDIDDLAPYLAELVTREVARVRPVQVVTLRLGEVVDDYYANENPTDPRWLHVDDAMHAVECALNFEPPADGPQTGWWVFHIPGGGPNTRFPVGLAGSPEFGYVPRRDLTTGAELPFPPPPIVTHKRLDGETDHNPRRVVIYGAGGPVAAVTAEALARDHILRLADLRPLADTVAENRPHMPGAPLPRLFEPPHEIEIVDVTDPEQVLRAARAMDAMINCAVVRDDPAEAFRVNVVGVYNMLRAALVCNIRRFVHTGPPQESPPRYPDPTNYGYDFDLPADAPARPGSDLYHLTKYLSQEICRIFADVHGIETPVLTFAGLVNPAEPVDDSYRSRAWLIAWEDAGAAMRKALRVPSYPRNFEVLNICSDMPHGKFCNDKAKRLLAWQPRLNLEKYWRRNQTSAG